MKEYILSLLPRLSQFSKGLNNSAILVDQPWIFLNEQGQQTKFVFRPNQELLVSINGAVQKGRWEYLTAMDALLIEHGNQTQLFSQAFIDKGILVLNRDNTTELFVLINSNVIPDLDAVKYLGKIVELESVNQSSFVVIRMRNPPTKIKIFFNSRSGNKFSVGNKVEKENGAPIEDGIMIAEDSTSIEIKAGEIISSITPSKSLVILIVIILLIIAIAIGRFRN